MANQTTPGITNPLQTNNTALVIVGYAAGVLATKFPIFDSATWNTIVLSILGAGVTLWTAYTNRKTNVVKTVAQMPEVNNVDLDKSVPGASALANAAPANVVAK